MKKVFLLIGFIISIAGCHFKSAFLLSPQKSDAVLPLRDRYVIMVLIDGGRPQEIEKGIAKGLLPHFKKLFYEEGLRVQNAMTVFPTMSSPAHQAFLSGLMPGHHGVPALDWFSRTTQVHLDYLKPKDIPLTNVFFFNSLQFFSGRIESDQPQLIFNRLQSPSMAVYETANEGASIKYPENLPIKSGFENFIQKAYEIFDFQAMNYALKTMKQLPDEQFPRFAMVDLYGMDFTSHFTHSTSERVQDLYVLYDRFLGEIEKLYRQRGIWEKTTLIVVSDHGQHELHGVIDLPDLLERVGLSIERKDPPRGQVVWGDHGSGTIGLYLKKGQGWEQSPTFQDLQNYPVHDGKTTNLIQSFLQEPDIEWVMAPENLYKTHFYRKNEHAVVERKWDGKQFLYAYQPDLGSDPFRYLHRPNIQKWVRDKKFVDAESWLRETAGEDLPDAIVGTASIFDGSRAGDLILISVKDKQFKEVKLSSHGSLESEDRKIILLLHGADIQKGEIPYARSVDVYHLILAILGLRDNSASDGILRKEFLNFSEQELQSLKELPQKSSMSLPEFESFLQQKLQDPQLTKIERQKAVEILYSLKEFLRLSSTIRPSSQPQDAASPKK